MRKKLIDPEKCMGCKNCELACVAIHSDTPDNKLAVLLGGVGEVESPRNKVQLDKNGKRFPEFCRHCDEPACVEACMSGALTKGKDGFVTCDHDLCVGCYMCVMSCPYGMARPSVKTGNKMIKCDGCKDHDTMACVAACPQRCIRQVDDESATGGHLIIARKETEQ